MLSLKIDFPGGLLFFCSMSSLLTAPRSSRLHSARCDALIRLALRSCPAPLTHVVPRPRAKR